MRTTADDVKAIFDTDINLTPFLALASMMIADSIGTDSGMSEERLTEIEKWLTAHLACAKDPRATSEGISGVTTSYQTPRGGEGLSSTFYGQQVLLLDTSCRLANANKPKALIESI
jgi:hypothetical protein